MKKTYYLTTPIYYINAKAHIGHAYTTSAGDCIARYQRMIGNDVFFLTGTDEHGQKIFKEAAKSGKTPKEFADAISDSFRALWGRLHITFDFFIRTTDSAHREVVTKSLQALWEKGDIYVSRYCGWYCTPCETFWNDSQVGDSAKPACPDCKRPVEHIEEDNYFFKLSKYQAWLMEYIQQHPDCIQPQSRYNEVREFLRGNTLSDLCICRPKSRVSWGIPFPINPEYVVYVWFDALLNYLSGAGYLTDTGKFSRRWPADVHLIGKDILRQHAIYWPIMLKALDIEPPKTVFSHGWWLTGPDEKMSKSKGNVVDPEAMIEQYGADSLRYFLLRETPFGLDGVYSEAAFIIRRNSDLSNDLGNLVHRSSSMAVKYYQSKVPEIAEKKMPAYFTDEFNKLVQNYCVYMEEFKFHLALECVWGFINRTNKYVEDTKPWVLSKEGRQEELALFMYTLLENIRLVAVLVYPCIPQTAEKILGMFGIPKAVLDQKSIVWGLLKSGTVVQSMPPLFPRVEITK